MVDKLAKEFVRQAFIAKRKSDTLYEKIIKDVRRVNKYFHRMAIKSYDQLLDNLSDDNTIIANSMDNLEKLSIWMPSFDMLQNSYRVEYRKAFENNRVGLFHIIKDKEFRLMKVVARMGIKDDRVTLDDETLGIMNKINDNLYTNIGNMLNKWRGYVYDTFFQGITQSKDKETLRSDFLSSTGTLKIGSSLEETSELEASMAAVSQKTTFLQRQAKKNNYRYCWNANPMDRRTKPICMQASLAGVIEEEEMIRVYGLPPRFICRCEIVYTHEDWVEFNQGINEMMRDVRTQLIERLIDAPRQLAEFYVAGRLIIPSDAARASGTKMYADIEEKLELARANEVPDFIID